MATEDTCAAEPPDQHLTTPHLSGETGTGADGTVVRVDPPSVDRTSRAASARQVPGFDLLDELGRGGMGVVYRARQHGLGRVVALKMVLHGVHATADELDRFRGEAEAIARLRHANIVEVYAYGETEEGLPYFALEFCAAEPSRKVQWADAASRRRYDGSTPRAIGAVRPRCRHHSPRPQARQCPPDRRWYAEDHRLRPREGIGRGE